MTQRILLCFFLLLWLASCKVNHFLRVEPKTYTVENTSAVGRDSSILAMIQPYKSQLDAEMDRVIGIAAADLERGRPEGALGNLVADALAEKAEEYTDTKVSFALSNSGGLRIPTITKGEITKSDVFELLPFDNILVILELDSALVKTLADHMASSGGWPVSKALSFDIVQTEAKNIRIAGQALQDSVTYRVAMPDYVANGGSNSDFLVRLPQESTGRFMRDAVIEYIQEQKGPIKAEVEGRVEILN